MKSSSYNQIVYGSLLHPKELKSHGISIDMIEFVRVKGYKRIFNQEPSRRRADTINRAVLNIQKDNNSWFNAILIKNISENSLKELDIREIGYDRLNLQDGCVKCYKDGTIVQNCFVYMGKDGKQNSKILPNIDYFKLCLNGAKSHFDRFHIDYLSTTYQNSLEGIELISDI